MTTKSTNLKRMKREEKEEMNRDEKEVKQLWLSSLFTICTDGRSPPQSSMMTLFMFKIVKRMKICQKQKQKCKKQLCKRKGCFVGLGRLSRFPCCVLSYFSLVFVMEHSRRWQLYIGGGKMFEPLFRAGLSFSGHFFCKIFVFDISNLNFRGHFLVGSAD